MQLSNARTNFAPPGGLWSAPPRSIAQLAGVRAAARRVERGGRCDAGARAGPPSLRGYSYVSVRAVARGVALDR